MDKYMKDHESGHGEKIEVEFHGDTAIIIMRRGENRINFGFIEQFNAALDEVERNPTAKVLITTAEGKFYSNGLDLGWLQKCASNHLFDTMLEFNIKLRRLTSRLLTFPMPTIAALNGHTFAGGAIMAVVHDYKVMNREKGWFCFNEIFVGIPFDNYLMEINKTVLPQGSTFNAAVVRGQRFTGEMAFQAGIVQRLSDTKSLLKTSLELADLLTTGTPYQRDFLFNMKCDAYKNILDQEKISPNKLVATFSKL